MALRCALTTVAASALIAGCGTAQLPPNSRGDLGRFTVSIGMNRMNDMGGQDSAAMKAVLDEHAKRYCKGPYTIRSVSNTAAEVMFNGRCNANE